MVGTTGDQKFASLEKIIVPLESVQRDESKYVFFYDIIQTNKNFAEKINFLVATQYSPVLFPHPHESPNRRGAGASDGLGAFCTRYRQAQPGSFQCGKSSNVAGFDQLFRGQERTVVIGFGLEMQAYVYAATNRRGK